MSDETSLDVRYPVFEFFGIFSNGCLSVHQEMDITFRNADNFIAYIFIGTNSRTESNQVEFILICEYNDYSVHVKEKIVPSLLENNYNIVHTNDYLYCGCHSQSGYQLWLRTIFWTAYPTAGSAGFDYTIPFSLKKKHKNNHFSMWHGALKYEILERNFRLPTVSYPLICISLPAFYSFTSASIIFSFFFFYSSIFQYLNNERRKQKLSGRIFFNWNPNEQILLFYSIWIDVAVPNSVWHIIYFCMNGLVPNKYPFSMQKWNTYYN